MKLFVAASCLFSALVLTSPSFAQDDGWVDLFNGKDLTGWTRINGTAPYTVDNGEIVGATITGTPNSFLATDMLYGDFALRMEVLVDDEINSGIQFRSLSNPDYMRGRVHGHQFELDPSERAWSGGIYDEARRGWLYPLTLNPDCSRAYKHEAWNSIYIEAIGAFTRTWLNDVPCAALNDDMTLEGFIALQVHSIGNADQAGRELRWRKLQIKTNNLEPRPWTDTYVVNLIPNTLAPQEEAQGFRLLFDGETTDGWRGVNKETFPEQGWHVADGVLVVEASGGAEAAHGGDIVTMEEFAMYDLSLDFMYTKGANSGVKYIITESYGSKASAIGLEYQILDDDRHPDASEGAAGNRTLASLYDLIPADESKTDLGPGEWNRARIRVTGTRTDERVTGNRSAKTVFTGAHVEHWLNDRIVVEYDRGTRAFDALVARSKYVIWKGFGHWPAGHILLQDHGDEVHFRSIKIRRIPVDE